MEIRITGLEETQGNFLAMLFEDSTILEFIEEKRKQLNLNDVKSFDDGCSVYYNSGYDMHNVSFE